MSKNKSSQTIQFKKNYELKLLFTLHVIIILFYYKIEIKHIRKLKCIEGTIIITYVIIVIE